MAQPSTLMNRSAMSSDMETLLVLGGAVEGYDLSPAPELIGSAACSADGRLCGCIIHRSRRLLQLPLGNPVARAGWLRRQMCLLWSLVLIG